MSLNSYIKNIDFGRPLEGIGLFGIRDIFKSGEIEITLWSLHDLIKLFPNYKILENKYISFKGTDVLIHIENYEYFIKMQEQIRYLKIDSDSIEINQNAILCIKLDNNNFRDHKVHFIHTWMIKSVKKDNRLIVQYSLKEDIPNFQNIERTATKKMTPMSFKRLKKGIVWA
jgi:hypothetical protein